MKLLTPELQPTIPLWPDAGTWLGLSRSSTYAAARRGEIPTIRIGGKLLVPNAALRRLVHLEPTGVQLPNGLYEYTQVAPEQD